MCELSFGIVHLKAYQGGILINGVLLCMSVLSIDGLRYFNIQEPKIQTPKSKQNRSVKAFKFRRLMKGLSKSKLEIPKRI